MKRPLAYLTAAWSGEPDVDMELAAHYCRLAYEAGFSPICPLLYLPLFLNDSVPEEHKAGIDMRRDIFAAFPHPDRLRRRCGRGCKNDIAVAGRLGIAATTLEGVLAVKGHGTPAMPDIKLGSLFDRIGVFPLALPGAVSVRYGPVRLKKRRSP